MTRLLTRNICTMTELREPQKVLDRAGGEPVAVRKNSRGLGCCVAVEKDLEGSGCGCMDLNNDGRVNLRDYGVFQTKFNGGK